jgi:hypothetical protein
MTGQLAEFENLSKLSIDQLDAIRSHRSLDRLIIIGFKNQFNGNGHLNHDNFPKLTALRIQHYTRTEDCKDLLDLAKHLQSHGINLEVNGHAIEGTDLNIVEQLRCYSLLRTGAIWTAVLVLVLLFIIVAVVLCRYHLSMTRQRKLVKILAKTEFERYQSIQCPADFNVIRATIVDQVDASDSDDSY